MCKYFLDCKTTCTLKRVKPLYSEVTLWESADEKKLYCPYSGRTRIVKKYNPYRACPFINYNKPVREKIYLVIL